MRLFSFVKQSTFATALIALILILSFADNLVVSSESRSDVRAKVMAAFKDGVANDEQFELVSNFVKASGDEAKWREIPWIPSLWEGIKVAEKKRKPLFVWAMNGDPLGCV